MLLLSQKFCWSSNLIAKPVMLLVGARHASPRATNLAIKPLGNCRSIVFIALSIILALVTDVQASEKAPGAFAQTVSGARPVVLGEAYTAMADDANAIWWNPAGISQLRESLFTSTYANLYNVDGLSMSSLGFAAPTDMGAFGAGITYLRASDIPITDSTGNLIKLSIQSEEVLTLSYGNSLLDKLHLGAGIRYLHSGQVIDYSGLSLDFGLLANPIKRFCFGATLQQMASYITSGDGKESRKLPRNVKIAAIFGTERISTGLGLSNLSSSHYREISAGCEVVTCNYITLRAGLQTGMQSEATTSWGAGIGFRLERIQIDYSYMNQTSLASSHLISITISITK